MVISMMSVRIPPPVWRLLIHHTRKNARDILLAILMNIVVVIAVVCCFTKRTSHVIQQ